jgi:hypothetical protein
VRLIAGNLSCVRTEKRQRCSPGRAWQRVDRLQAAQAADVADGLVAITVCPFRWRGADGGTPTSRRARRVDFDGQPVVPAENSKSG